MGRMKGIGHLWRTRHNDFANKFASVDCLATSSLAGLTLDLRRLSICYNPPNKKTAQ